ncbi:MAG: FHA domain-containing protein [Polyangiaceae bacterium]
MSRRRFERPGDGRDGASGRPRRSRSPRRGLQETPTIEAEPHSGLHCRLSWDGSKLWLTDLGSSNGTFLRISDGEFRSGDVLLMGQQLFRIAV